MKRLLFGLSVILAVTSCDSIDCTLYNTVECQLAFYDATGQAVSLTDTLDVKALGTDSILYNKGLRTSSLSIPLSYYKDSDTLVINVYGQDYNISDQLIIAKTNIEHFESIDCPVKMFHTIKAVSCTNHFIDSVAITSPIVEYNNGENIKIYLHTAE